MKKKKIFNFIVDVLLIGIVLSITDAVSLKVFHSENFWLELGIYLALYTIAFGTKRGIIILWNKYISKKKERNENEKISTVIWGIVLIAAGALFALNALNITNIDIFFDGWWTLFIIVPCAVGLFTEREKTGNIIGIAVGVFLLLCCQDILSFSMLWKLLVPAIIVIIGLKMVFTGLFGNKANEIIAKIKQNGGETKVGCATFSGCDLNYDGEVFEGAELTATFGGVKCDLRNAIIEKDCAIQVSAIFGGIDIFVPAGINVKVSSNCIFGGISNKTSVHKDAPTIYISGTCMFGGVEIK